MVVQEQEEELGLWGRKGLLGRYMYKYSMECGCGRGVPRCGVEKVCFPHHATGVDFGLRTFPHHGGGQVGTYPLQCLTGGISNNSFHSIVCLLASLIQLAKYFSYHYGRQSSRVVWYVL